MTSVHADLEAIAHFPDPEIPSVAINIELVWHAADPAAVQLAMWAGQTPPTIWVFARDLLAAGVHTRMCPVGGDVRVCPSRTDRTRMEIWLTSNTGRCVLVTDRADVQMFLESTWRHVPPCAEGSVIWAAVDRILTGLGETEDAS